MPKTNTMTVRVSDDLKAKLDKYAELTGRSMSYVAAAAVEEYLAWRVPQLEDLEKAIDEADAGLFASDGRSAGDPAKVGLCRPLNGRPVPSDPSTASASTSPATIPSGRGSLCRRFSEGSTIWRASPIWDDSSEHPDVSEFVVARHYLVSYRVRQERVEILQVWHTAQNREGS